MQGYQLSFFTQQDQRHQHHPVAEWLLLLARDMGLRGATVFPASEGFGAHRRIHAAHFLDLSDQPQQVVMVVSEEESQQLMAHLRHAGVHLFYVKTPVEFGVLGPG